MVFPGPDDPGLTVRGGPVVMVAYEDAAAGSARSRGAKLGPLHSGGLRALDEVELRQDGGARPLDAVIAGLLFMAGLPAAAHGCRICQDGAWGR